MSTEETIFRAALLLMGFIIVLAGAAMAWKTEREVTPMVLIAAGVLGLGVAVDGAAW